MMCVLSILLRVGVLFGTPTYELPTQDPERLVAFYERIGAKVTDRAASGTRLDLAGTHLLVKKGAPAQDRGDRTMTVLVDDLSPWKERLGAALVSVEPLRAKPGPRAALLIVDPAGYRVVIRTRVDARRPAIPVAGDLNALVLRVLERYPTDGTHRYHWPRKGKWKGCTKDLRYGDAILCKGDADGRAYCCGLTFEVFLDAWRLWCQRQGRSFTIRDMDLESVRKLQSQWFGSPADKTCIRTALVANRLGRRLIDWTTARSGDFVQLWRNNGTGHSVVFLRWIKDEDHIIGLEYWSTQKSTRGIGRRVEYFGSGRKALDRSQFYLCRVGL